MRFPKAEMRTRKTLRFSSVSFMPRSARPTIPHNSLGSTGNRYLKHDDTDVTTVFSPNRRIMTWHRPPPKSDPPSVALLRALGVLQELGDGAPIAAESGIALVELWPLIERGVTAGYIDVGETDEIGLTPKGQAWWKRRHADR
jgi:hypothetical protein